MEHNVHFDMLPFIGSACGWPKLAAGILPEIEVIKFVLLADSFFFFLSLLSDKFTQDFGDCLMSRDCEREALKWFRLPAVRIVGTKLTVQIWGHSWISHEEILSEGTISLHSFADAKRLENELKIFRAFRKKTKSRGDIRKKKVEIFYHFHLSFMNTKCRGKCLNNYFIHLSCFF